MSLLNVSKHIFNTRTSLLIKCSRFHTLQKLTPVHKVIICGPLPKRTVSSIFRKVPITSLRSIDKVPKSYELMYRNDMDRLIQVTQIVLFVLSTATVISCILKSEHFVEPMSIEKELEHDEPSVDFKVRQRRYLLFLTALVTLVSVLHFYTSRLPVRIYYNAKNKDYIACLYGVIPNTIKKQNIKIGEMKPLTNLPSWSIFGDVTYQHDTGYRFILFENYFRRMSDLYIMLGIQEDVRAKGYVKPDDDK